MTVDPETASIPARWEDVTASWMTAALARRFPGAVVSDVSLVLRDDGTNRRARFRVEYSAGTGPPSVFLKASDLEHAKLNAATGGLFNEARLFQSGVELPVEHPVVHLAVIDEPRLDFVLVMEDVLERGCDPRDATRPLTVEQATNGVRALARLHSAYWNERLEACEALAWVEPYTFAFRLAAGIDIGKAQLGETLPEVVRALDGADIDEHLQRHMATVGTGAQTLLHGDPHIGNTYVCPDDEIGFLDWQVAHRGSPALDLAYFAQGALTIPDRRMADQDLVAAYLDELDVPAVERPDPDELSARYAAGASYGMALWLATAASRWQRPEVSRELALRYASAFVDLDAEGALTRLGA